MVCPYPFEITKQVQAKYSAMLPRVARWGSLGTQGFMMPEREIRSLVSTLGKGSPKWLGATVNSRFQSMLLSHGSAGHEVENKHPGRVSFCKLGITQSNRVRILGRKKAAIDLNAQLGEWNSLRRCPGCYRSRWRFTHSGLPGYSRINYGF